MTQYRYTKKEAINIVTSCAKVYLNELCDRNILLLCTDKHKRTRTIELAFYSYNYLHLTGLKLHNRFIQPDSISVGEQYEFTANAFFQRCLDHQLSPNDFDFSEDETTEKKLDVLPIIITKNLSAKMVGDYNNSRPKLFTEKLAGGVKGCIGFIYNEAGFLIPNTVLNVNIKDVIHEDLRVVATFRKSIGDIKYTEITYIAKKVQWNKIVFADEDKSFRDLVLNANESRSTGI